MPGKRLRNTAQLAEFKQHQFATAFPTFSGSVKLIYEKVNFKDYPVVSYRSAIDEYTSISLYEVSSEGMYDFKNCTSLI